MTKWNFKFELVRSGKIKEAITANDAMHFQQKAKIVKNLRHLAFDACDTQIVAHTTLTGESWEQYSYRKQCAVRVRIYPPSNRRFDPPNFYPSAKALIDGFTDAGLWDDDNWRTIQCMSFVHGGTLSGKRGVWIIEIEVEDF